MLCIKRSADLGRIPLSVSAGDSAVPRAPGGGAATAPAPAVAAEACGGCDGCGGGGMCETGRGGLRRPLAAPACDDSFGLTTISESSLCMVGVMVGGSGMGAGMRLVGGAL